MTCYPIYDVSQEPFQGWFAVKIGLLFLSAGIVQGLMMRHSSKIRRWSFLLLTAAWLIVTCGGVAIVQMHAVSVLRNHRAAYIEGYITDYRSVGPGIHGADSFVVDGLQFEIRDGVMGPGYKKTRRVGGPLVDGTFVRIAYSHKLILRLEVCAHD